MKLHRFLLSALLVLGLAGASRADTLFTNLLRPGDGGSGFNNEDDLLASDFLTDGIPRTVTSVTARISSTALVPQVITFRIFSDDAGSPGAEFGIFETPAAIPPGTAGEYTATTAGISLQANTIYWLVGQQNAPSILGTISWRFDLGEDTDGGTFSTVPATQFKYSANGGLFYTNIDAGNLLYSLEGTATVPEPGSITLLALGAIAALAIRRSGRPRM